LITTSLMFINIILTAVLFYKVCLLERLCFIKIGT